MTGRRRGAALVVSLTVIMGACSSTPLFDKLSPDLQQGIKQECRDELEERLGRGEFDLRDRRLCWEKLAEGISSGHRPTTTAPDG